MNFFEHQQKARQHTLYLVMLFALAVLTLITITILFLMGIYADFMDVPLEVFYLDPFAYMQTKTIIKIALGVIFFVAAGSIYKYMR
ncbi:MAG: hypothetical protein PF439_05035, partial [Helicobacteraceae bacterium]|nr:hypothetical protein [Helicobacteraceae bacterium]